MREKGEDPLILDAGDMFFSTTSINTNNLKSEKHRCETMLSGYEKIGCDGFNIGKYELLAGITYLKQLEKIHTSVPFISANIRDKNTNKLIFSPYKIIQRESLSIGVIGLANMVPDTMKSIIVDDYVKSGNEFIKKLKNDVDVIVLLVNSERNTHASMAKNFKDADFIFLSGSTHRTSPSVPQNNGGPFVYSNGKQGKYLTVIDLELKNNSSPIIDVSSHEQKIRTLNNRLKRLQRKDPNKSLEEIYADQENILSLINRYRNDLQKADSSLTKATNRMKFGSLALNKSFKDDPVILAMVDSAIETCSTLNLKSSKPPKRPKNRKKHNHIKRPKPPKVKSRP